MQKLGLSSEYKDTDSEIGKWLSYFFGLSFLNPTEVEDCFVEDLMALPPQNDRCSAFVDYVLKNYISSGAKFPPILWSEEPSDRRRTTNGCESFHCHFIEQFYTPHPSIFSFLDVIAKHQCIMYIKLRNADSVNLRTRTEKEKLDFLAQRTDLYRNGEISRLEYLKRLGFRFRFRARTDV